MNKSFSSNMTFEFSISGSDEKEIEHNTQFLMSKINELKEEFTKRGITYSSCSRSHFTVNNEIPVFSFFSEPGIKIKERYNGNGDFR